MSNKKWSRNLLIAIISLLFLLVLISKPFQDNPPFRSVRVLLARALAPAKTPDTKTLNALRAVADDTRSSVRSIDLRLRNITEAIEAKKRERAAAQKAAQAQKPKATDTARLTPNRVVNRITAPPASVLNPAVTCDCPFTPKELSDMLRAYPERRRGKR